VPKVRDEKIEPFDNKHRSLQPESDLELLLHLAEIKSKVNFIDRAAFLGVTVQPMVKMEGYELILGSSLDPQFVVVMKGC